MSCKGKIININNKYVIDGERKFIILTPIMNTLLPDDIVEYIHIDTQTIEVTKLLKREIQFVLGIIKNIENGFADFICPELPKFFSPTLPCERDFEVGFVAILQINMYSTEILYLYDHIKNRKNDKDIILDLYKLRSQSCSVTPLYEKFTDANHFYSHEFVDLTHLNTFNVDPTHSKDFDDAISIDHEKNKMYVHIVDAYEQIECDSPEDTTAFKSAFTLYLPEHIENILPRELAEEKLSLIKGVERKTITVEFDIDPHTQNIVQHKIYKSTIRIKERYDYEEFSKIVDQFPLLVNFYNRWKRNTLDIPHIKMNIDKETGIITSYFFESNNDIAHKIIETLMILTNITVSTHLPFLIPQRYHSKVKCEFEVKPISNNPMIDAILTIKKYRPAIYDSNQQGHFGLGINSYTHFTSPIRRYFDVIIHRLLAGVKYSNLEEVLDHINKREVQTEKLVKLYENLKILDYLDKNKSKIWKGYIINITKSGVVVLLEDLAYEIFIFTTQKYELCQPVQVKVNNINWAQLSVKSIII